jgi:hypothetical protein
MNITTTKSISQLTRYERQELHELLIRKYGLARGTQIFSLADRIDSQRKFISAMGAVDRAVEWFRRQRI